VYRYKNDFVSTAILARAYRTDGKVYNKAKKVKFLSPNDLHVLLQDKKNTFYKNITDYLFVDLGEQKIYDLNKPYNPSLRTLRKLYNKNNTERLFYTCQIESFEKRTRRDYTFGLNLIFDYGYKEDCYNLEGESIPQYSSGAFS